MSKIVRYSGNLRAFAADAIGTERTIFGEVTQANDLTSQFTADFFRGWGIVGPSDQPALEDFNGAMYTHGQLLAYLHQAGVAEYDTAQEYFSGSVTQFSGGVYISKQNANIGNSPTASGSAWWDPIASSDFESITATVAANALTLTRAAASKNFRNPTLTNGAPVKASPAALSLTVPSGATLGTRAGFLETLVLLLAYNAGTPVLCVANLAGGLDLSETALISPTTISAGATSATTIYSATAVAANSPYRVVGYTQISETTPGTWTTGPTLVQPGSGQALAAMQSLGYGQTWQNVIASRAYDTLFYNLTSRPIVVSTAGNPASGTSGFTAVVNGVTVAAASGAVGATQCVDFIVPPGGSYRINTTSGISDAIWSELRGL